MSSPITGPEQSAATETLDFTASVVEIRELARVEGRQVWQILLSYTEFQADGRTTGTLQAIARSGAVLTLPVTAIETDAGGEVWHTTTKPLQPDTVVRGSVFRTGVSAAC